MEEKGQAGVEGRLEGRESQQRENRVRSRQHSGVVDAHGRVRVPNLESQVLPWRKRPLPGGGLGIVINIIDTPVGQLSLFPSGK